MNIATERHDNCTLTLTVEVDEERLRPELQAAARQLAKRYPIAGFRPGKAPYETIVRHFGEDALYDAALDTIGQKVYEEALDQEKIEAYGPGSLDDVQRKPLVLKFTVPLRPDVDLGDYRAVRVPYAAPSVSDEAVQEGVDHLREHQAVMEPVDRPAAMGDVATVDVSGYLGAGENQSDYLLADKDVQVLLDEKTDWPLPGFGQHLLGAQAGEERKFDQAFPEDYANESLRGQLAHFEVVVKEIKSRVLPEWSDELAKTLGDYESLDDLRAKVRADLEQQAAREVDQEYTRDVVDRLVEQAAVKYPPMLLEQEVDDLLEDLDRRLREQRLTLDDYLKIENKTPEALREEYKPQAEKRLKRALVLGKVVELEGLKLESDAVETQIDRLSALWGERAGDMRKALSSDRARQSIEVDLLTDQALKRLAAIARGEEVPAPAAPGAETPEPAAGTEAPAQ